MAAYQPADQGGCGFAGCETPRGSASGRFYVIPTSCTGRAVVKASVPDMAGAFLSVASQGLNPNRDILKPLAGKMLANA